MRDLTFASGHRPLVGRVFDPSIKARGDRCGVLFVHGQRSSQEGYEHRARSVSHNLGAVCFTFDLSEHGHDAANFDRYSGYDHLDDVVAAFDCLASQRALDRARIGVCGASYGGYLAALLTAHRAVKRLILRAPSLVENIHSPPWQQRPSPSSEVPERFDSLSVLRCYGGQVLVIESEKDEIIPASHIAAYLRVSSHAERRIIHEATHALLEARWDEEFISAIVEWFRVL